VSDVVAFDLRSAGGSPTGVGRHLMSIVRAVAERWPDIPIRAYVRDEVAGLPAGVKVVRIRSRGPLWHLRVWWDLRRRPVRAYCSTSLLIPALTGVPALPVVLDVISFMYPQFHTWRTKLAERLLMRRAIRRHPIVAGSETTRVDVERLFGPCRAVVVPPWVASNAPSAAAAPVAVAAVPAGPASLERLDIHTPFALYVGTIEPRKNVLTAVRAMERLRIGGRDLRLVVVGAPGWVSADVTAELDAAEKHGTIVRTGYVSDDDRDAIFASAACLVLPSIYEGFGLPLLEAMSRGLPCVCSDAPAFREVAGDAALVAPALDAEAWAAALERILSEPDLAARLSADGRRRAETFSPERTAEAFAVALAQLAG
jgi:glycosyltransferase involved in cell wall biosynthesis